MVAIVCAQRLNYKKKIGNLLMSERLNGKQNQTVRCIIKVSICNKETKFFKLLNRPPW